MRHRFIAILTIVLASCVLVSARSEATSDSPREIQITAKRFSYTPSEITLKKGEPVVLIFKSEDVTHGFIQPDWNVRAELHKNKPVRVTLQPDTLGTFEARCSYFCGTGHGSMRLFFHVVE